MIAHHRLIHIAAAIIRRGDDLLLVQQQAVHDSRPNWVLPGGRVEPGELPYKALIREVREETGLVVDQIGALAYTAHHDSPYDGYTSTAFVFEVAAWRGDIVVVDDPDGLILHAEFVSLPTAMERLAELPWRNMSEPVLAYLRGDAPPGQS